MSDTHSGYEEFLDLVDGPLELDLGTVVRVLHCDQDVEVLVEVLPVGLTPVHLLLKHTKIGEKKRLVCLDAPHKLRPFYCREGGEKQDFTFLLLWLGSWTAFRLHTNRPAQSSRLSNAVSEANRNHGMTVLFRSR